MTACHLNFRGRTIFVLTNDAGVKICGKVFLDVDELLQHRYAYSCCVSPMLNINQLIVVCANEVCLLLHHLILLHSYFNFTWLCSGNSMRGNELDIACNNIFIKRGYVLTGIS